MPRERRIVYPGAVYHLMARGNRREDIVFDDADRLAFEATLEQLIERTGWVLFAWVLMGNHYHLVVKTPEPNLVEGMHWFQNTWTRRFNARHQLWGHLFGNRYKSIPVEENDYLGALIHYVHLNPVRAGMVKRRDGIESYRWSSLGDYLMPKRKRRAWVAVERGLRQLGLPDSVAGRRRLLEWTEKLIDWRDVPRAGYRVADGQSLQSTLRRGWYFGTERFRERLLGELQKAKKDSPRESRRKGYSSEQERDHGIAEAERIISVALEVFGLSQEDWGSLPKGDWRKGLVAAQIRERAMVPNQWLAQRLLMGATGAVSRTMARTRKLADSDRKIASLAKRLERNVKSF